MIASRSLDASPHDGTVVEAVPCFHRLHPFLYAPGVLSGEQEMGIKPLRPIFPSVFQEDSQTAWIPGPEVPEFKERTLIISNQEVTASFS